MFVSETMSLARSFLSTYHLQRMDLITILICLCNLNLWFTVIHWEIISSTFVSVSRKTLTFISAERSEPVVIVTSHLGHSCN